MPLARSSLLEFPTPVLSDALESLGRNGAAGGWRALGLAGRIAGRVVTLRLEPAAGKARGPHLGARAIHGAAPGDVIVVANAGRSEAAAWGGLLSLAAKRKGVAAVIVDGLARDADEIETLGVALLARGFTPASARGRYREAETGGTVQVAGIEVAPGDIAVLDASGVVFFPKALTRAVIARTAEIAAFEGEFERALRDGGDPRKVLGARYEKLTRRRR